MSTTFNRLAVYGHRGWASSAIFSALAASGAPVKLLYRPSSDVSNVPDTVTKIAVDVEDTDALVAALEDVDIVISLVGHEGIERQHALVKAIPQTKVKLFSPSDLAFRVGEDGLKIASNRQKRDVENAAKEAGIPITLILPGSFAESALSIPFMGIDLDGNRLIASGDSDKEKISICSRPYVAAAYASIFASTPPSELANRIIGLSEATFTGADVAWVLEKKHNAPPKQLVHSLERVNQEMEKCIQNGSPMGNVWYCRKMWGTGQFVTAVGTDIWDLKNHSKASLEDFLLRGRLEEYRAPKFAEMLLATFN